MPQLTIRKPVHPLTVRDGGGCVSAIMRLILGVLILAMVAGCTKYAEWNKPRARRDANPPPDHSYCWQQAERRAAEQYAREATTGAEDDFGAYGRSSLSGDLRRMDAQRLREELYENCLTLRAQARDAEKAAAEKAAAEEAIPTQASVEENVGAEGVADMGPTSRSKTSSSRRPCSNRAWLHRPRGAGRRQLDDLRPHAISAAPARVARQIWIFNAPQILDWPPLHTLARP